MMASRAKEDSAAGVTPEYEWRVTNIVSDVDGIKDILTVWMRMDQTDQSLRSWTYLGIGFGKDLVAAQLFAEDVFRTLTARLHVQRIRRSAP